MHESRLLCKYSQFYGDDAGFVDMAVKAAPGALVRSNEQAFGTVLEAILKTVLEVSPLAKSIYKPVRKHGFVFRFTAASQSSCDVWTFHRMVGCLQAITLTSGRRRYYRQSKLIVGWHV